MGSLQNRLLAADSLLVPYAVPHAGQLGRPRAELEDLTRFPFQRDRDRIIHSQAFRRLQGKTQVFVAGEGDHYRTRLTHTMEVAQIARDMARTLTLNEDLAESIALAHDLGHPPFGHMGEQALDAWMREHGASFEHNKQSLRIVTVLEEHSSHYLGLNLNQEILEGLQKHALRTERAHSLEAQLVNSADEIAYTGHDCDDGLRAGLFSFTELRTIPLAVQAQEQASRRGTSLRGALIHLFVMDVYGESERRLQTQKIRNLDDVYRSREPLIGFSPAMQSSMQVLRNFLFAHMYSHPRVLEASTEGQTVIRRLCERFLAHPPEKILALQKRTKGTLIESIKDYVAGMTDSFAQSFPS